jgi:phosphoribosylanthranilate isomerase
VIVKICGITSLADANAAVDAGASALGFVFWPGSPRFIDPYRARTITRTLPPFVVPVGVFVNQPAEYVNAVAAVARLGAVQLHGDEGLAYAVRIGRAVIKAVHLDRPAEINAVAGWPSWAMPLMDAHDPAARGGTGRTIDWAEAAQVAARRRSLLAGGLTPENVAEAVARVRPFGIDISSGVERSPGVKDPARIRALFEALHDHHASRP